MAETENERKLAYIEKQLALDPPREPEDIKMLTETRKRILDRMEKGLKE